MTLRILIVFLWAIGGPLTLLSYAQSGGDIYVVTSDKESVHLRAAMIRKLKPGDKLRGVFFIHRNDKAGLSDLVLFLDAARRGVDVELTVDGIGSFDENPLNVIRKVLSGKNVLTHQKESADLVALLQEAGARVNIFHPPKLNNIEEIKKLFHRNHGKLVIAGDNASLSDRNVENTYWGDPKHFYRGLGYELQDLLFGRKVEDRSFLSAEVLVRGSPVAKLQKYVDELNDPANGHVERIPPLTLSDSDRQTAERRIRGYLAIFNKLDPSMPAFENVEELTVMHDNPKIPISAKGGNTNAPADEYIKLVKKATKHIRIFNPYVLPTTDILDALKEAIKRGVKVEIITNSHKTTDNPTVHRLFSFEAEYLRQLGIDVKVYDGPHALHLKVLDIDGEYFSVGTFNLDPRSRNLNMEEGLWWKSNNSVQGKKLSTFLDEIAQKSVPFKPYHSFILKCVMPLEKLRLNLLRPQLR